ncbi:MAG: hypothetical protein EVJ46_04920 [Candidatus Acididesulfobacter guangdongensis]|uniref:Zinc finger/thioredoxin putative domain-containing protein n=1 Tax=Acididesulfobacter guangdongensis TaxID=2597225 RepID=A0A519BGJ6_ACIG2|nr:MAG: hypothetical protein EVJ46_04920 [Candidatus Acididesulfobacter guangdongensis]
MRILCPFCATSYDIDELLLPDGNIKVRCRNCANIFIINKKIGVITDNSSGFNITGEKEKNNSDQKNIEGNIKGKEESEKNEKAYDVKTISDEHSAEFGHKTDLTNKIEADKAQEYKTQEKENKNIFESEEIKKILKEITDDIEKPDAVKSPDALDDNNKKKEKINKDDGSRKLKNKNNTTKKLFLIFLILIVIIIILYALDFFGIIYIPYLVGAGSYINGNFFKLMSEL